MKHLKILLVLLFITTLGCYSQTPHKTRQKAELTKADTTSTAAYIMHRNATTKLMEVISAANLQLQIGGGGGGGTGLVAINEGNGFGWRLSGRDAANYGSIGLDAIDFSASSTPSIILGATGAGSFAGGVGTRASGISSFVWGQGAQATGDYSTAIGFSANASGLSSNAIGSASRTFGDLSNAIGANAISYSYGETVIGMFNTSYSPISLNSWNISDRLFVVGDGTSGLTSDAFLIWKNGEVAIPNYGTGSIAGTATYNLAVDANGKIIEEVLGAGGGGTVDIQGTPLVNEIPFMVDSNTLQTSPNMYFDGTDLLLGGNINGRVNFKSQNGSSGGTIGYDFVYGGILIDNTVQVKIDPPLEVGSYIIPVTTGSQDLGLNSFRWSTIYGVAGNFSGNITAANFSGVNTGDQIAIGVPFTPYSTITSTDVQAAIQELLDDHNTDISTNFGNVDNTSDASKPISIATQTALDLKANQRMDRRFVTAAYTTIASDDGNEVILDVGTSAISLDDSGLTVGFRVLVFNDSGGPLTPTIAGGDASKQTIIPIPDTAYASFILTEANTWSLVVGSIGDASIANSLTTAITQNFNSGLPNNINAASTFYQNTSATNVTYTVGNEATDNWRSGYSFYIKQASTGTVTLEAGAGVTLNAPDGLVTDSVNDLILLVKTGTDIWDVIFMSTSIGGGESITASNGLTRTLDNITLGGEFTQTTTINSTDGDSFLITSDDRTINDNAVFLVVQAAGGSLSQRVDGTTSHVSAVVTKNGVGDESVGSLSAKNITTDNESIFAISSLTGATYTDAISSRGIDYAADYSANSTARSLIDKAEIESLITASGGGNVSKVGTPVNNQIGVWTGDGTLEGDPDLTYDGVLNRIVMTDATTVPGIDMTNSVSGASSSLSSAALTVDSGIGNQRIGINGGTNQIYFRDDVWLTYLDFVPATSSSKTITFPNATGTVGFAPATTTPTTVLDLSNNGGNYANMASANATTTYTFTGAVLGGYTKVLINTTSEPTVTGATKIAGATWVTGTNMYMVVANNGTATQFYFLEI